jgi:hypothetical protein
MRTFTYRSTFLYGLIPNITVLVLAVLGGVEIHDPEFHGEIFLSHLLCHLCPGAGKSWEQSFHFVFALIFSARHYLPAPKNYILLTSSLTVT